ncbi:MAG TPA: ParB N-terminal domain-containing protein [Gemmataceae bacterium]|jgi:ParB-like chromosome segregation protein Spo0J|nr:ParB N-terminal domain-containing protein [Gemmataceae bacterium]
MESSSPTPHGFEVRLLPIDRLVPAPYNPRRVLKPTDRAYRKLEASLRRFGLVEPLIWNEATGYLVGGHARLAILKRMGLSEVPVSVVHLSDAREKALNVVMNNQEAQGRYDAARLARLMVELEGLPELAETGFDRATIPALKLAPVGNSVSEGKGDQLTVSLVMPAAKFDEVSPRLDELIAEFDLTSHVTRN